MIAYKLKVLNITRILVVVQQVSRVRRQATSGDDADDRSYDVEISLPSIDSEEVTNENTGLSDRIERILESIILEQNKLNVNDALPNVVLDPSSFDIDQEFACPEGEVVVGNQCGKTIILF